jgi:hypothetical protein
MATAIEGDLKQGDDGAARAHMDSMLVEFDLLREAMAKVAG